MTSDARLPGTAYLTHDQLRLLYQVPFTLTSAFGGPLLLDQATTACAPKSYLTPSISTLLMKDTPESDNHTL
jgi:hypothetical protein